MKSNEDQSREILLDITNFAQKEVIGLGIDIVSRLRDNPQMGGTPIDTGWASSNWIPSIGKPVLRTYGKKHPNKLNINKSNAGIASLAKWTKGPIFICNNVPYINYINMKHKRYRYFVDSAIKNALASKGVITAPLTAKSIGGFRSQVTPSTYKKRRRKK